MFCDQSLVTNYWASSEFEIRDCEGRESRKMNWLRNLRILKIICLILGVGLLGATISYGAEDNGGRILWVILIACSLFFIIVGLTAFKKRN